MLEKNPFLKATPLYKEYAILEILSNNAQISQRSLSRQIDASLSMINKYIEDYENQGFIKRKYINGKKTKYILTQKGVQRLKMLNMSYLKSLRVIYSHSKELVIKFLENIISKNFKTIIMYGAGNVAELILEVIFEAKNIPIKVIAIIDDDQSKIGNKIMNIEIFEAKYIKSIHFDAVLISSYNGNMDIYNKLIKMKILDKNIIKFF